LFAVGILLLLIVLIFVFISIIENVSPEDYSYIIDEKAIRAM
jgi:hypothetical protein